MVLTNTMQHFIESYCSCEVNSKDKPKHIIENHIRDILEKELQPVFKRQAQIHPTLSKRPEPKYRAAHESDLHENQQWKLDHHVELLFWLMEEISVR